jgi:hypothetical protein
MTVVINELEIAPQPEAQPPAASPQDKPASGGAQRDPEKQMLKVVRVKSQRSHRLEAY